MLDIISSLTQQLSQIQAIHPIGRVDSIASGKIEVSGLNGVGALGDRVEIGDIAGEVAALHKNRLIVFPEGEMTGLSINQDVKLKGALTLAPDTSWMGRIIDPIGRPLDGRPLFAGKTARRLVSPAPLAAERRRLGKRLETGKAVLDTLLPIVRGQRVGLFAGSGVGKSRLLGDLARSLQADVVVIALVGERGRELRDFTETVLGKEGLARSVVVTATSDQSPLMRRRCALSAMSVAEHFRDNGAHVLLLMDSITRFAEAHREISLATGEPPSLRGYPPSLQHMIMSMAERAGPGSDGQGDITAVFSVLVSGSDMDEPVADIVRGVLDGHIILDREIAQRGRFPAIDVLRSVSRALPEAALDDENRLIMDARKILGTWSRAEMMIQAGLYQKGSDPDIDRALRVWPVLDGFISENTPPSGVQGSFERLSSCLSR